jgi:hypothetical protein
MIMIVHQAVLHAQAAPNPGASKLSKPQKLRVEENPMGKTSHEESYRRRCNRVSVQTVTDSAATD